MNKIFNGRGLAILIAIIALLNVNLTLAKDYSVTAGNWQVNFKSNETLYTSVDWKAPANSDDVGYYTIWINKDPGTTSRSSAIFLFDYGSKMTVPTNRAWMEEYTSGLIAPFNNTPSIYDYIINGKKGLIAEGWSNEFEKFVYAAMFPFDPTTDNTAQKIIGYDSNLDEKTTFEILDSLQVKYVDSPQNSQTSTTAKTNNWVYPRESQETAQQASANSGMKEPYVLIKCKGTSYNNIGQYTKAAFGKVYFVTNLQIENHGYNEFSVNPNYVKIEIDKVQYDYSWVDVGDLGLVSLDSVTLKDGGIVTGAVAFEIPSNANQYSLVWSAWKPYNVKVEYV